MAPFAFSRWVMPELHVHTLLSNQTHSIMRLLKTFLCLTLLTALNTKGLGEESPQSEVSVSEWVTSISRLGESETFIASTGNGLLMQPASVDSFSVEAPTTRERLYSHPAAVWAVTTTTDGKLIASVDYRGNLGVFDVTNAKLTLHENALERWCQSLITSPEGESVIAGNEAGKIIVWNLTEAKATKTIELDGHAVTGLAVSPDRQTLAASDGSGHVHLLKWPTLEKTGKVKVSETPAWCLSFLPDGNQIVVGCGDNHVYRIDNRVDAKPEVIATGKDWITNLSVSNSGHIAAAEVSGSVHIISHASSGVRSPKTFNAESGVWALNWNKDQELFVGTRKNGIARIGRSWDWVPEPSTEESSTESTEEATDPNETTTTEEVNKDQASKPKSEEKEPEKENGEPEEKNEAPKLDKPETPKEKPENAASDKPTEKE